MLPLLAMVSGLVVLPWAADLLIRAASNPAQAASVPGLDTGLTVVSLGTTLPVLARSIVAAWRGQSRLTVGSCLYSVLFTVGIVPAIHPIDISAGGWADRGAPGRLGAAAPADRAASFQSHHTFGRRTPATLYAVYTGTRAIPTLGSN